MKLKVLLKMFGMFLYAIFCLSMMPMMLGLAIYLANKFIPYNWLFETDKGGPLPAVVISGILGIVGGVILFCFLGNILIEGKESTVGKWFEYFYQEEEKQEQLRIQAKRELEERQQQRDLPPNRVSAIEEISNVRETVPV